MIFGQPVQDVAVIAAAVAAFLTSVGVIWAKGVKPTARFIKRVHGMYETLLVIEERSQQLTPNSGSHMRDAINRIEGKLDSHIVDASENFRKGHDRFAAIDQEHVKLWRTLAAREVADAAATVINPETPGGNGVN